SVHLRPASSWSTRRVGPTTDLGEGHRSGLTLGCRSLSTARDAVVADAVKFYYDYDLLNRQIHVIEPPAAAGTARGMTYSGYDAVSNRVMSLDQEGRPTYFTYDAINREA